LVQHNIEMAKFSGYKRRCASLEAEDWILSIRKNRVIDGFLSKPSSSSKRLLVVLLLFATIQVVLHRYVTPKNDIVAMETVSPPPQRLEFVHITKTGGSAIERAGFEHGINWGACHYTNIKEVGCSNPDIEYTPPNFQSYELTSPWHMPPSMLSEYIRNNSALGKNPYDGADLFTVVRNPYDRIVSEYYCPWQGFKPKLEKGYKSKMQDIDDPIHLNSWVKDMITNLSAAIKGFDEQNRDIVGRIIRRKQGKNYNEDPKILAQKHFINQAKYVYDDDGNVIVKNIIHYENLSEEFHALMQIYGLSDLKLPNKQRGGVYTDTKNLKKRLTYRDLDEESIRMINEFAKPDFERLGYTMVEKKFGEYYSLEAKVSISR